MAKKPDKRKPDDPEQSRRFEETARDVGAEDNARAFERAIQAIKKAEKSSPKSGR